MKIVSHRHPWHFLAHPRMEGDEPTGHTTWDTREESIETATGGWVRGQTPVGDKTFRVARPRKRKMKYKGDCFIRAAAGALGDNPIEPLVDLMQLGGGEPVVVHGVPLGRGGDAAGLRYAHAWIEYDGICFDFSNGLDVVLPRFMYYDLGKIDTESCRRYTPAQVRHMLVEHGHHGP